MKAPILRLDVDPSTPASARADLGRARDGYAYDAGQGFDRFQKALENSGATSGAGAAAGAAGATSAHGLSLRSIALVGGAAIVVASAVLLSQTPSPLPNRANMFSTKTSAWRIAPPTHRDAPSVDARTVSSIPPDLALNPLTAGHQGKADAQNHEIATRHHTGPGVGRSLDSAPSRAVSPPVAAAGAKEEIEHLSMLRTMATVNPARAVIMAEEGHRRFSGGLLRQEREAIAVLSLVTLGNRAEATRRGASFVEDYAGSALAKRVQQAVGVIGTPRVD